MAERRSLREVAGQFDKLAKIFDELPIQANADGKLFSLPKPGIAPVAVDVGCGTGATLLELSKRCERVYGVDVSHEMLERAKGRAEKQRNVSLIRASADALPLGCGSVDYVISHTTFHHLKDARLAFFEIRRVLRPGGIAHIVDIVARGVTGRHPVLSAYLIAAIRGLSVAFRQGVGRGQHAMRMGMHRDWIEHQRGESFLEEKVIEDVCERILPGAVREIIWSEYYLTPYVHIIWQKEAVVGAVSTSERI